VDLQKALFAISEAGTGKPVVLLADRGRGKSHIMAAIHHSIESSNVVVTWAQDWGQRLGNDRLMQLKLPSGFLPITEAVHNNEYEYLWDLLFERHPYGQKMQGKFEASGVSMPARSLLEEMFSLKPTVLIVDECQTWYDGLNDEPGDTGRKRRSWTFNFIQVLSELAKERPDIFRFIISVRNNQTDAFRQVHRDNPALVDFKGVTAPPERRARGTQSLRVRLRPSRAWAAYGARVDRKLLAIPQADSCPPEGPGAAAPASTASPSTANWQLPAIYARLLMGRHLPP